MPGKSLSQIWESIADRGREILATRRGASKAETVETLCRDLLSERGEASGMALAREIVSRYEAMPESERLEFFQLLGTQFSADVEEVLQAAERFRAEPSSEARLALSRAIEPPRQELIRRINLAPRATAAIVAMRESLLRYLPDHPELHAVDADFRHILRSWFNRGFLILQRIDWRTPAAILEKLFEYEAVHEIRGWEDMRRRLEEDRRCFAFFHPALPEDPLIFVEVALLEELASSIHPLLDISTPPHDTRYANTAIFYSINNCQDGLRGISFGSFLIKQVVADLLEERPRLKIFATLSPAPGFLSWLRTVGETDESIADLVGREQIGALDRPDWHRDAELADQLQEPLLAACAHYLVEVKDNGEPVDPVARFHLGNGASIERINWLADTSEKGLGQAAGIMVNYSYRTSQIEKNHEAYVHQGRIAASSAVRALLRKVTG